MPDKLQINFNFLHSVAFHLFGSVNDDLVDKLVNHHCGQLGKVGVFSCKLHKLLHTDGIFLKRGYPLFGFCHGCLQGFLLGFIFSKQGIKAFIGNTSDGKGFIELFDDIVKLGNAFLVLAQPALGFFRRFLLLDLRSGTYLFCKFLLIRDSKGADGADGIQNKFPNGFCADIVTAAGVSALLMRQCIGGAIVEVRGIGAAFRAASGTVVGHLCSAVSAEHKSRQRICFTKCIVASRCLTELLCKLPRFLIHDGFVGVLKDQPFLFGIHHGIFVLVGLLVRTEVDRVPHIFGLGKNLPNDITTPVIRVGKFLLAFPNALVLFAEVNGRGFHLIIIEDTGNVIGAFALDGQSEYSADNLGGFLVDIPTVLITRHLLVAVDGAVCCRLARFAFYTDSSALFAAQVP